MFFSDYIDIFDLWKVQGGFGRASMTKTVPNDTRRVVWALGASISSCFFINFCNFQVKSIFLTSQMYEEDRDGWRWDRPDCPAMWQGSGSRRAGKQVVQSKQ